MILSAHQPHYLPWAPYFYKICAADCFVFADDVQFKTDNYINRTRIKNATGLQWLTVPVDTKGRSGQLIKDVRITQGSHWRKKHRRSIWVNYKQARYFDPYRDEILGLYDRDWRFLIDLNMAFVQVLMRILKLPHPIIMSSDLALPNEKTERIVAMAKRLKCRQYLSGPGGHKYMDVAKFRECGIALQFSDYAFPQYAQRFGAFLPGLSILDMVFNLGEEARHLIENHPIVTGEAQI